MSVACEPSPADRYRAASRFLAALDPAWADLIGTVGPCLHDPKAAQEPYEALVRAIAYQQLHAKAGDAILSRLKALTFGAFASPQDLVSLGDEALRGCGFSAIAETIPELVDTLVAQQGTPGLRFIDRHGKTVPW